MIDSKFTGERFPRTIQTTGVHRFLFLPQLSIKMNKNITYRDSVSKIVEDSCGIA